MHMHNFSHVSKTVKFNGTILMFQFKHMFKVHERAGPSMESLPFFEFK